MSDEYAAARGALSFGDAIYEMVSLRAATALITSKESLKGPYESIALVSALMLTMTSLAPDGIGGELAGVDEELADRFFTVTSFLCTGGFFMTTLLSAMILLLASTLEKDSEALGWVSQCQLIFKLCVGLFFFSLFAYLVHVSWQFATLTGVGTGASALLLSGWCSILVVFFSLLDSMRVVYTIHHTRRHSPGLMS